MITNSIVVLFACIFAFIPLILGERARDKSIPSIEDFVVQGRTMNLFPMYTTVFATWMSAFAFIGGIAYFFEEGPIYMTTVGWDMLFALLFIVIGRRIWFYGKHHGYMTSVDFIDDIYGSEVLNIIVTVINIMSTIIYMQAQVVAAVLVMQVTTTDTISPYVIGFIFFAILILYLWAGGLRAVSYADTFYMILIIGAMLASGVFLVTKAGGTEFVFGTLANAHPDKVQMTYERIPLWVSLFLIVPIGAFMGPQVWIRNYAAKGEKNYNILPLLLGLSSIISIGTLLAGSACIILAGDTSPDLVLLTLMKKLSHPYFNIFIVIGIFAAIFSTANSQIHALASIFSLDVYKRYINRKATEERLVHISKWAVLFICLISYIFMIVISRSLFDLAVFAMGCTAQIMIPVAGALYWSRSDASAAVSSLLAGEISFIVLVIISGKDVSICALIAFALNLLLFIVISLANTRDTKVSLKITQYKQEYDSRNTEN